MYLANCGKKKHAWFLVGDAREEQLSFIGALTWWGRQVELMKRRQIEGDEEARLAW